MIGPGHLLLNMKNTQAKALDIHAETWGHLGPGDMCFRAKRKTLILEAGLEPAISSLGGRRLIH